MKYPSNVANRRGWGNVRWWSETSQLISRRVLGEHVISSTKEASTANEVTVQRRFGPEVK